MNFEIDNSWLIFRVLLTNPNLTMIFKVKLQQLNLNMSKRLWTKTRQVGA